MAPRTTISAATSGSALSSTTAASLPPSSRTVSYTHLDVYKRQRLVYPFSKPFNQLLAELDLTKDMCPFHHLSAHCVGAGGEWLVELMPGLKSLLTPGLSLTERARFVGFGLAMLRAKAHADPDDATSALQACLLYTSRCV